MIVLVADLLATDATISGDTELENDFSVPVVKYLDYLGDYPTDVASWTISPTTDLSKVEISITASSDSDTSSICLYLDDTKIVNDLVITSESWTTTVVAKTINITAGSHKLTVSGGSTDDFAPSVASINIKGWE